MATYLLHKYRRVKTLLLSFLPYICQYKSIKWYQKPVNMQ